MLRYAWVTMLAAVLAAIAGLLVPFVALLLAVITFARWETELAVYVAYYYGLPYLSPAAALLLGPVFWLWLWRRFGRDQDRPRWFRGLVSIGAGVLAAGTILVFVRGYLIPL